MTIQYVMRAAYSAGPPSHVYWAVLGSPDYTGAQSGYNPANLSNITIDYQISVPINGNGGVVAPGLAGGDLSGTFPNPSVVKIQGESVSTAVPTSGQSLQYNGINWAPANPSSVVSGATVSGDLSGTLPSPSVVKIQGTSVSSASVANDGYALVSKSNQWVPQGAVHVFNVKNFGAVGDGSVHSPDESIAFQNAINAANAAGGGTVYIPIGTYIFQTPSFPQNTFIQPLSNVCMRGDGDASTIKIGNNIVPSNYYHVISANQLTNPNVSNVKFENFCIDGNSAANQGNSVAHFYHLSMIAIANGADIIINNCLFKNSNGYDPLLIGDWQLNLPTMDNVQITNCRFENMGNDSVQSDCSIVWLNTMGGVVSNNIFSGPNSTTQGSIIGTCVEVHGQNVIVSNNKSDHSMSQFFNVGAGAPTGNVTICGNTVNHAGNFGQLWQTGQNTNTHQIEIADNVVSLYASSSVSSSFYGIWFHTTDSDGYFYQDVEISNNIFHVVSNGSSLSNGIFIQGNLQNVRIENNTFFGFNGDGIVIQLIYLAIGHNFSQDVIIRNNTLINPGPVGIFVYMGADGATNHERYIITGNYIAAYSGTFVDGILVQAPITTLDLTNNIIQNASGQPISLVSVGTGFSDLKPVVYYGSGAAPTLGGIQSWGFGEGSIYQRSDFPNGQISVVADGYWQPLLSLVGTSSTATSGAVTLPGNPIGFIEISVSGIIYKMPYYGV